jgi:hypothetical protein
MKGGGIMNQMKGVIVIVLLTMVFLIPPAQAEEPYEGIWCYAGTSTVFHDSKDLTPIMGLQLSGIWMSHSENKFIDKAAGHCECVRRGVGEKTQVLCYCRFIEPDGDIVIMQYNVAGKEAGSKLLEGTGKYKGIKGSHTSEPFARGKPPMKGAFTGCNKLTGVYEIAK